VLDGESPCLSLELHQKTILIQLSCRESLLTPPSFPPKPVPPKVRKFILRSPSLLAVDVTSERFTQTIQELKAVLGLQAGEAGPHPQPHALGVIGLI
jgi:hypothetical protein